MNTTRPALTTFQNTLASVPGLSSERQKVWVAMARTLPNEFATLISDIARENPEDMMFLDDNLRLKMAAKNPTEWQAIIKKEQALMRTI